MQGLTNQGLISVFGGLLAGFAGGAIAWFATNFWGKPISKFLDLRLQAQETMLIHPNIGPYLADAARVPKASAELRRIAAQIGGLTPTNPPPALRAPRPRGCRLPGVGAHLTGVADSL